MIGAQSIRVLTVLCSALMVAISGTIAAAQQPATPRSLQRPQHQPPLQPIAPENLRPGSAYLSADLKALQDDDFANPGMLWVERGARMWDEPAGAQGQSCASCHGNAATSMKGVAVSYPKIVAGRNKLLTLEQRIRQCRSDRQGASPWQYESQELLSMSAFVASQSRGMPMNVNIGGAARPHFDAGRRLYNQRMGQMNLACTNCHDDNAGRRIYADRISQGHPNGFPAYRLEWQTLGSLGRRLRACLSGIRGDMFAPGSKEHGDLELYLAWRAQGLPSEVPGVRR